MARAKARFADAKNTKKKSKTKNTKEAASKETDPESDPSLHGEDMTEQHHSLSESEVDETPLGVLLAELRRPKPDPDSSTMKEIESLPVLQLFKHHLKGGLRPDVAKDHTRHVCHLLYELEDPAKKVGKIKT